MLVECGRVIKRIRPAPQVRGYRVRKSSNHVTIIVDSNNHKGTPSVKKNVAMAEAEPLEVDDKKNVKKETVKKAPAKKASTAKAKTTKKEETAVEKTEKKSATKNTKK